MSQKLCRKFFFKERLFNKSFTVYTATQFQLSWKMQQEASDEAIVVTILCESRVERRASVIQSQYFRTTIKNNGRIVKENDKVIANQ